jgi:hypothetical protein
MLWQTLNAPRGLNFMSYKDAGVEEIGPRDGGGVRMGTGMGNPWAVDSGLPMMGEESKKRLCTRHIPTETVNRSAIQIRIAIDTSTVSHVLNDMYSTTTRNSSALSSII